MLRRIMQFSVSGVGRIGICAACAAFAPSVFAAPADDLKVLLETGKHAEAYQLALRTPGEIGKPAFDFYYGVAAINSGKPSEGYWRSNDFC